MFDDFDAHNNQKQEDEEDSETLSYSYPSYSRFTYTGKTKSRLGRSRFMRQTSSKEESKKPDDSSSETSNLNTKPHFLQSNSQAPKTPGVSWLQRDSSLSSSNPFTPGGNSKNVQGSCSDLNNFPSQSDFLFNLKNDSVQNSSCKRNLPFSTTPFKSKEKEIPKRNEGNINPLRELNQLIQPVNPFSNLDFFGRSKNENKENNDKTKAENVKNGDFGPPWNQLKNICDTAIPNPPVPTSIPETNKGVGTVDQTDLGKNKESSRSNLVTLFKTIETRDGKSRDDDSSNTPLDLSSAESTARSTFGRSLVNSCDLLDGDTSGSLNRQLKDVTKESNGKVEDSTAQKTNTDALSGFLPKFLVPKNKNSKTDSPDDDVSAHSVGTVVERVFDFQPQGPFQKPQMTSANSQLPASEICAVGTAGSGVHPTQNKSVFQNDTTKLSPPSLPTNFVYKEPSPSPLLNTNNEVKSSSQLELQRNTDNKSSPPAPGNIYSINPPKSSPPSAHSIPDVRTLVNDGQLFSKQEEKKYLPHSINNVLSMKKEKEMSSLAQSLDAKIGIVSKPSTVIQVGNQLISDKNGDQLKSINLPLNSTSDVCPFNHSKSEITPAGSLINPLSSTHLKYPLSNQEQRRSEPLNNLYQSGVRNEARPPVPLECGQSNLNQVSYQQANIAPKPAMIDHRDPAIYPRPPENLQPSLVRQKTYLAPQQRPDRNHAGDFPHVKPEIPQLQSSKPSFPAVKKHNQFKMSVPRGMPSRVDTELSVNGKAYAILSMLGKGGSSEVYQVLDSCSSKLLAVKCVDLSMVDKTIADGYLNEIDLLSRLQGCASVIRMFEYEYVQECKMLYVVMEKGDTDLSHLIRDISKTKKISMSMIIYYWTEMLQAVKDIHDQGIIHSDLKPANFLLVSGRLKLIDFGIASSQGDMTSVVKEVTTGTWNYMSPEAIKNTSASGKGFKITYKSDVWSLGCILYNLVYGKTPFSHITNTWGKLTAIADPNHCIEFPDVGAPAVLVKALRSCFHREPKLRPTVAELLSLPYHSTGQSGDLSTVGRQVQALLPAQCWLKVAHLFPEVKSNQEGKHTNNAG